MDVLILLAWHIVCLYCLSRTHLLYQNADTVIKASQIKRTGNCTVLPLSCVVYCSHVYNVRIVSDFILFLLFFHTLHFTLTPYHCVVRQFYNVVLIVMYSGYSLRCFLCTDQINIERTNKNTAVLPHGHIT